MPNSAFTLASLLYITLLTIAYFGKRRINNIENKIYAKLVLVTFAIVVVAIIDWITIGVRGTYPIANEIISRFLLILFTAWPTLITYYILVITRIDKTKNVEDKRLGVYKTFSIIYFVGMSIALCILPLNYYSQGSVRYSYGAATKISFLESFFLISIILIAIFSNRKHFVQEKYLPILLFIVLEVIVGNIQKNYPAFLLSTYMNVYITFLMYFTIENPDVKVIEQLNMAKNQAEKANKAKTDFLSSMSHEIRTPLNAIVGFSELINESDDIDEAKENATDVINASSTLLEIVNSILDISKIESGKIEIVDSPYKARETFEQLAKLITPRMNEKELVFKYKIADDLPEVLYGDHANVKKVVTNLLSNAVKYTDAGCVNYEVNCIITDDICKLIISVEDTGRGIKKEKIDKLFQKFERFDTDRNTTIEGTGLGLAITKNLVELMGGKIIVHTVYGEGSKFTIVLDQKIETSPIIEEKKIDDKLDLKGKKVLIVDDNEMNLKVAKKLFEKNGCTDITLAKSGYECLDELERRRDFDVILLDDMMPKMSGTITLKKIKEREIEIPVVALTANALTGMKESYLESGFDDFISKPMEKKELATVLNKIFDKRAPKKSIEEQENEQAEKSLKETEKQEIENTVSEPVEEQAEEVKPLENTVEIVETPIEEPPVEVEEEAQPTENTEEVSEPVIEEELTPETEELIPNTEELQKETPEPVISEEEVLEPASEELTPVEDEILEPEPSKGEDNMDNNEVLEPTNEEVLEPATDHISNVQEPPTISLEEYMRGRGVDMDAALELLGDMGMYEDTLKDFKDSLAEKWSKIEEFKLNQDMKNYAIEVHSLKSDCKYLGFMDLANVAYEHEMKSKENDIDFVNNNFNRLSEEYTKLLNILDGYSF